MNAPLPKYVKDARGYCYAANPILLKKEGLTPWDGPVGKDGYAITKPAEKPADTPAAKKAPRSRRSVKAG